MVKRSERDTKVDQSESINPVRKRETVKKVRKRVREKEREREKE